VTLIRAIYLGLMNFEIMNFLIILE